MEGPFCGDDTGESCSGPGCGDDAPGDGGKTKTKTVQNVGNGDSAISSLRHTALSEGELSRLIRKLL